MNKSNIADLINFSNSCKKSESKLYIGKNSPNLTPMSQTNNNFFIKKNNENSYSDIMNKKDNNSNSNSQSLNASREFHNNIGPNQTYKKPFINRVNKK